MSLIERARVAVRDWLNKPAAPDQAALVQHQLDMWRSELQELRDRFNAASLEEQCDLRTLARTNLAQMRVTLALDDSPVLRVKVASLAAEVARMSLVTGDAG